ncbi:hypothetical protein ACFXKW_19195 [Streptomyces sp. NPDC059193]|uniref:hypothetical protein n=1 Tax=Streptomyces sp. NPDC059193 TaxID=3346763 RepID=UPI0036B70579
MTDLSGGQAEGLAGQATPGRRLAHPGRDGVNRALRYFMQRQPHADQVCGIARQIRRGVRVERLAADSLVCA